MIEQRLGTWGDSLSGEELALSLLGLGLVPLEARKSGRPATMSAELRRVLNGDPETMLHWSLDALPAVSGRRAVDLARDLATIVRAAMYPARRIAIAASGALDGLEAWALLARSEAGRAYLTEHNDRWQGDSGEDDYVGHFGQGKLRVEF